MANAEQLKILRQGVEVWNKWIEECIRDSGFPQIDLAQADLSGAKLMGANLNGADLTGADLRSSDLSRADLGAAKLRRADLSKACFDGANFRDADLTEANLTEAQGIDANLTSANLQRAMLSGASLGRAHLMEANLFEASLTETILWKASLFNANLRNADLREANLGDADLREANLSGADLTNSDLRGVWFLRTNVSRAKISGSSVYGINVWDLQGKLEEQKNLIITSPGEPVVTVDDIEVAQFIYLIINNEKIRNVINTITSKSVLILGRFALPERKEILNALKDKLREYDLLPIVFDFDRPTDKDLTETIKTLAGLCYFVIADVTNPKSSPLELQATVPDYQIPFVPIIQEGERPFPMMADLQKKYNWVLPTRTYSSKEKLISKLKEGIIDPAMEKHNELRLIKAQKPDTVSLG